MCNFAEINRLVASNRHHFSFVDILAELWSGTALPGTHERAEVSIEVFVLGRGSANAVLFVTEYFSRGHGL